MFNRFARAAAVTVAALTLANCSSSTATRGGFGNKYGVSASPKVIPDGQPIPKGGGREMIGKPYIVGGATYVPSSGKGYVRDGYASWYGAAFHGRLTANGEIFDKDSIAAAHPTLPLPSYVRVTNLVNHASMIVRVNDRGPYERSRVMDVSERVAEALQFRRAGTTRVRVEYVGRASLKGSDDRKLLATLQTDGTPAGSRARPIMLAQLDEHGPNLPPLAFKRPEPGLEQRPLDEIRDEREEGTARVAIAVRSRSSEPLGDEPKIRPAPISSTSVRIAEAEPGIAGQAAPHSAPSSRPDHPLDLATIPGAARPLPPLAPPTREALSEPRLQLPPERPILAGLYYAAPTKVAASRRSAEPFAKLDGRRVVSLKSVADTSAVLR